MSAAKGHCSLATGVLNICEIVAVPVWEFSVLPVSVTDMTVPSNQ